MYLVVDQSHVEQQHKNRAMCIKGKCESYNYSVKVNIVHTIVTCLFVYTCINSEFGIDKGNDESEDKTV
jgi:hypothetical protein